MHDECLMYDRRYLSLVGLRGIKMLVSLMRMMDKNNQFRMPTVRNLSLMTDLDEGNASRTRRMLAEMRSIAFVGDGKWMIDPAIEYRGTRAYSENVLRPWFDKLTTKQARKINGTNSIKSLEAELQGTADERASDEALRSWRHGLSIREGTTEGDSEGGEPVLEFEWTDDEDESGLGVDLPGNSTGTFIG